MIVFKGKGTLWILVTLASVAVVALVMRLIMNFGVNYLPTNVGISIGALLAGVLNFLLGRRLNRNGNEHAIFWIPLQHSYILNILMIPVAIFWL